MIFSHFSKSYWISQIKATLVQFSLDVAFAELGKYSAMEPSRGNFIERG